jgi:hypothetical protein
MPWKETTTKEQKIEFICECRTGKYTITKLSKGLKTKRPLTYKLIDRFKKKGFEGLKHLTNTLMLPKKIALKVS